MSKDHEYMSRFLAIMVMVMLVSAFLLSLPANAQSRVYYINTDRNVERGQEAMRSGDYERAVAYLQKAARGNLSSDHKVQVNNSLCASLFLLGSYDEATEACSTAIEEDGRYWKAFVNRGHARKAAGDIRGALADYCQAHTLSPRHVNGPFVSQCEG